jgi:murein DD-endopeptidase MepM/ murein hydrolase activator NlpD
LTYYGEKLFYVNGGLNNYNVYIYGTVSGLGDYLTKTNKIKNTRVLPIISDPVMVDSDNDSLPDNVYKNSKDKNDRTLLSWVNASEYLNVSDPNPLKADPVWQWPVVAAESVGMINGKLYAKVDSNNNKLTLIDKNKSANINQSFTHDRGKIHSADDIVTKSSDFYVVVAFKGIVTYIYDGCSHTNTMSCQCNTGSGFGSYGNCIEITSEINGVEYKALYGHLKKGTINVTLDTMVYPGDVIGQIGSSGRSSAEHLDFSIATYPSRRTQAGDKRYDPLLFNGYFKF